MNPIETYQHIGAQAGTAARRRDQSCARFHFQWFARAQQFEPQARRAEVIRAFNAAYSAAFYGHRATSTPTLP